MSLELHRSALRDQALAAGQPAETAPVAEPASPGAPDDRSSSRGSVPDAPSTPSVSFTPSTPGDRSASSASAGRSTRAETSVSGGSSAPSAPDTRSASRATAEPSASAEASGAVVREPARDAVSGRLPPGAARPDESSVGVDGPLIADAAGLRASWRRVQRGFVDDPREAVADAASLVEHTAQALVGALRQRQRLLRATWDRDRSTEGLGVPAGRSPDGAGPADSGQPASPDAADTEQLRLLMHQYRDLFNHICQP